MISSRLEADAAKILKWEGDGMITKADIKIFECFCFEEIATLCKKSV